MNPRRVKRIWVSLDIRRAASHHEGDISVPPQEDDTFTQSSRSGKGREEGEDESRTHSFSSHSISTVQTGEDQHRASREDVRGVSQQSTQRLTCQLEKNNPPREEKKEIFLGRNIPIVMVWGMVIPRGIRSVRGCEHAHNHSPNHHDLPLSNTHML